jgi:hypothetical protein
LTPNETHPEAPFRPGNDHRQKSSFIVKSRQKPKNTFIYSSLKNSYPPPRGKAGSSVHLCAG